VNTVSAGKPQEAGGATDFGIVMSQERDEVPFSTLVHEFTPETPENIEFQSEQELEDDFIKRLVGQGYEFLDIHTPAELLENVRSQIVKLNPKVFRERGDFTDSEWNRFCDEYLLKRGDGIVEKTRMIQVDPRHSFKFDDGHSVNIAILDKETPCNNKLQVIHQYETVGTHNTRYDVSILVNGLPLVHVELKKRGENIKEAFNQINRYQRESFWADTGLYQFIQLFVISNGFDTRYYSNTTREGITTKESDSRKTSDSFEFTIHWATDTNTNIRDIVNFTRTFFAPRTILNILTRYCVFDSDDKLLVMRPYQIAATEKILNRIIIAFNYGLQGSIEAGGYIWHTTGSGKTLTSFKTAQLASKLPQVDKVIFVVDRRDLDSQTVQEYKKFSEQEFGKDDIDDYYKTKNTAALAKMLSDPQHNVVVTTIQKLTKLLKQDHSIYSKNVVIIFDECHRSQFGAMHKEIVKRFKSYFIFGFTGTPIFTKNKAQVDAKNATFTVAEDGTKVLNVTTASMFGKLLHTYTIVDAIRDETVLPFKVDYHSTFRTAENITDEQVEAIDTRRALGSPQRIAKISEYILSRFLAKTFRKSGKAHYWLGSKKKHGFNSLFTVSDIPLAKQYYTQLKKQIAESDNEDIRNLKIATIFSYAANGEENISDTDELDGTDKEFLDAAIADYNAMFGTSFDTSAKEFQLYYDHVSKRMKARELDLLIVVNMFTTGFDAKTLNTLWVDKNLQHHGLLQAFSRTNRILSDVKKFGNIVCFRNLDRATDEAIELFGDTEALGLVRLRPFDDYYYGYTEQLPNGRTKKIDGYEEIATSLLDHYPPGEEIIGEANRKHFIRAFNGLLKLRNTLSAFDEFVGKEIISQSQMMAYQSMYLEIRDSIIGAQGSDPEDINDDLVFEIELIKQIDINIDYILDLVGNIPNLNNDDGIHDIIVKINQAVNSSPTLRAKKPLIDAFVERVSSHPDTQWRQFVIERRNQELAGLIAAERLNSEETKALIDRSFRIGELRTTGDAIRRIMPVGSLFAPATEEARLRVKQLLENYFERYEGLGF